MTKMNRRLQQFLDVENITQAQFAARINVAPASISHILAGRNKPGYDFMLNTMKAFPDLNIEWLISGQGRMLKRDTPQLQYPVRQDEPSVAREDGSLSLFPGTQQEEQKTLPESQKSSTDTGDAPNIESSASQDSPAGHAQAPEKQRKATKIVVFYNDGTFQEFQ